MGKKQLSILIITYNSQDSIEGCLKSIQKQNFPADILIIDNASTDDTWKMVQSLKTPDTTLIRNEANRGFAKAVNQGMKLSQKKLNPSSFLLLNPDTTLEEKCLKNLSAELSSDERLGLLSPIIKTQKNNQVIFKKGQINWLKMNTSHNSSTEAKNDYLTGCCLMIKKAVLDKIDGLDERFFLYYEDADFSLRAQEAGFKIKTDSRATCFHQESSSSDSDTKTYYLVKNGLLFFQKHFSWPARLFYFWPIFWIRFFYHTLISRKKPVIKGLKDFYFKK